MSLVPRRDLHIGERRNLRAFPLQIGEHLRSLMPVVYPVYVFGVYPDKEGEHKAVFEDGRPELCAGQIRENLEVALEVSEFVEVYCGEIVFVVNGDCHSIAFYTDTV